MMMKGEQETAKVSSVGRSTVEIQEDRSASRGDVGQPCSTGREKAAVKDILAAAIASAACASTTDTKSLSKRDEIQVCHPQDNGSSRKGKSEPPLRTGQDCTTHNNTTTITTTPSSPELVSVGVLAEIPSESQPGAHRMFPSGWSPPQDDESEIDSIEIGGSARSHDFTMATTRSLCSSNAAATRYSEGHQTIDAVLVQDNTSVASTNPQEDDHPLPEPVVPPSPPCPQGEILPSSAITKVNNHNDSNNTKFRQTLLFGATILVLLSVIVGLAIALSNSDKQANAGQQAEVVVPTPTPSILTPQQSLSSSHPPSSTIQQIRDRGVLLCGYAPAPGFIYPDEDTGEITGFEAHVCYAIAAALQVKAEFIEGGLLTRFGMLATGALDIMVRGLTHTMERDYFGTQFGPFVSFSIPYLYTGLQAAGDPFYITQCVANDFRHVEECTNLSVCVIGGGSTHEKKMRQYLPSRKIVVVGETLEEVLNGFATGDCNVMVHEGHNLAENLVRQAGYQGEYIIGDELYSKEPLALMTRRSDPVFSDFVNAVLQALMMAEDQNITQATAYQFPATNLVFGQSCDDDDDNNNNTSASESFSYHNPNAFRDAIQAGGNYGELYERFLQSSMPRQILNTIYNHERTDTTGLLYSHPFGEIDHPGGEESLGPKIASLLEQGYLRCGIRTDQPGLAWFEPQGMFSGMDADYCRALSASLFSGDPDSIEFIPIESIAEGAQLLRQDELDVMAGAPWSLEMDIREPTTGIGFTLSQPYFYGSRHNMEPICIMTSQDDPGWSAYVYWIVSSTIYAEEMGIDAKSSNEMPEVLYLGPRFQRMLRDAILAVGNSAEIYERNMEEFLPRQAPNILNGKQSWGPQHHPMSFLPL